MREFLSIYHKHLGSGCSCKDAYFRAEKEYQRKHNKRAYANLNSFKSSQSIWRKRQKEVKRRERIKKSKTWKGI